MTLRPKLIITGYARHGKDTVCEFLAAHGYTWQSSSWLCGQIAVWPKMQELQHQFHSATPIPQPKLSFPNYADFEEAFADRGNHRAFWFDCIAAYNTPDETRLAREIFKSSDIYCGMRRHQELSACKDQRVADYVIWVNRPGFDKEPSDSCTVRESQAHWTIQNDGTLEALKACVDKLYAGFLKPWEARLADPQPALPNTRTEAR